MNGTANETRLLNVKVGESTFCIKTDATKEQLKEHLGSINNIDPKLFDGLDAILNRVVGEVVLVFADGSEASVAKTQYALDIII